VLVISPVHDLYAENGMDYVRLDKGSIPLDRITGVNGRRGNDQVDDPAAKGLATQTRRRPPNTTNTRRRRPVRDLLLAPYRIIPRHRRMRMHRTRKTTSCTVFSLAAPRSWSPKTTFTLQRRPAAPPPVHPGEETMGQPGDVPELGNQVARVAPLIGPECTLLNDLTEIDPDAKAPYGRRPYPTATPCCAMAC
jgi:hypothetical protein